MILPALAGLTAGATHALTGPDHVAAVLPLAAEAPDKGLRIGLSWATGHGLGTVVLAATALLVRSALDLDAIGGRMELLVGVALVVTGLWVLLRPRRAGYAHATPGAAVGLGTLHGLAGGAHVVVALSALALPVPVAVGWLAAFVLGAGLAMSLVGWVAKALGGRLTPGGLLWARRAAGLLALGVGAAWVAMQL